MRALLLAAGLGTRLRPLTDTVPKCLVDVGGVPLLDRWIDLLADGSMESVLVNLHHLADVVAGHLGRGPHAIPVSTIREPELLGTGGTLLRNRAFFGDGPAMVVHADNLSLFNVRSFVERFETRLPGIEITMMTFHTDTPRSCGIVELDGDGTVRGFHEKVDDPPGDLANAAVYIVAPSVIDFIAGLGKPIVDLSTEVLPHFIGRINTFENTVYHRDIGTPQSLAVARHEFSRLQLASRG